MGQLENEVRELILDRYKSLAVFARSIGIPEHTLYSALNNGLAGATLTTVAPIAKALSLDTSDIAEGKLTPLHEMPNSVLVPVYDSISATMRMESTLANTSFPIPLSLHESYPHAFMLRIDGNSMNRVLPDGFYALIDPCETVDASQQLYAVAVGKGDVTVKRVILHDNGLTLQPDSNDPTYRPVLYDFGLPDQEEVSIIGRVVWYCPPENWNRHRYTDSVTENALNTAALYASQ